MHNPAAVADTFGLELIEHTEPLPRGLHATAFDALGDEVVIATADGVVHWFEAGRPRLSVRLPGDGATARIVGVALAPDGRVLVRDDRARAVVTVRRDGSIEGSVEVPPAPPGERSGLTRDPAGGVWVWLNRFPRPGSPLLARLAPSGALVDTLRAAPPLVAACPPPEGSRFRGGALADLRIRYLPTVEAVPLGEGDFAVGCSAEYRFGLLRARTSARQVQVRAPHVPVSAEERESFVRAWTLLMRNAANGDSTWSWGATALPERKPAYHRLIAGGDGAVWVWPAQPARRVPAPAQWPLVGGPAELWVEPATGSFDVFGADGRLRHHVSFEGVAAYNPFSERGDLVVSGQDVWMLVTDTLQRSRVSRLRLRERGAGAE